MTRALTKPQYIATMVGKMTDVTATAQPAVDIWPYVGLMVSQQLVLRHVLENNLVAFVYRNQDQTFDHVLLPTSFINSYVAIIVDLRSEKVFGHFMLDLDDEYGIRSVK